MALFRYWVLSAEWDFPSQRSRWAVSFRTHASHGSCIDSGATSRRFSHAQGYADTGTPSRSRSGKGARSIYEFRRSESACPGCFPLPARLRRRKGNGPRP